MKGIARLAWMAGMIALLSACGGTDRHSATRDGADWPTTGRTLDAQRFSPLNSINRDTVGRLGLAWSVDLDTNAGQEATPIMRDGTLYIISAYDVVRAVDARTGEVRWTYDPQVRAAAARSCCGPVSRGVAVENGLVYVGALDGRLIALNAQDGTVRWQVQTLDDAWPPAVNYSITGAPRVIKGRVIIGNGGAEFGARGFITAYDAQSGKKEWRFYTVPGKPGTRDNAASDAMLGKVQSTWNGQWWRWGGGGTVWDVIEYDRELDLLYFGVGNGSPTNHGLRSDGKGDNLFLASIVAVRPDTGEYVWHYQETPAESWDYTATQPIILADLEIGGKMRKVLMQAPKNGFFYILDRATGELLSADPIAKTTWASHIDLKTGRPVENPDARYYRTGKTTILYPSSGGAHNWQPMSYSPQTGLVYLPVMEMGIPLSQGGSPTPVPGVYNTGTDMQGGTAWNAEQLKSIRQDTKGFLMAWDPVRRKVAWKRELAANFNGGVLSTGGGLVFQGNAERKFAAYDAKSGELLWQFDAQTGIAAAPITYAIDGIQYVAVMAGWGGAWPMLGGQLAEQPVNGVGPNRLLVFRLDGKGILPPLPNAAPRQLDPPTETASADLIARGNGLYGENCLRCHGMAAVSASMVPDLRHSGAIHSADAFNQIVIGGALKDQGMPGFRTQITASDLEAIRAYLIHRANQDAKNNGSGTR